MKVYVITQEVLWQDATTGPMCVVATLSSARKAEEAWLLLEENLRRRYNDVSHQVTETSYDRCYAECVYDTGECKYRYREWRLEQNQLIGFPFIM